MHRTRKKILKPSSPVFHSALSQGSSIYLPGIMYTLEEVKNMASLCRIGCTMTILQFKLLLLLYSVWPFLSIHYDVIHEKDTDLGLQPSR